MDRRTDDKSSERIRGLRIEEPDWTKEEETAVRWKLDLRIVPIVSVLYLLCFLDRANIGNARIQGLAIDLELTGYRFNWALTFFYIGYFLVEIPSNLILMIIGAKYYLPSMVVAFGFVSMCTAFVTSYKGLLAARFVLGLTEGGLAPGISYYLSCFYRRSELLFRISLFIDGACLAGAFGGLLAAGLSQIPPWGFQSMQIHTWRNIFFFEGILTILFGFVAMTILPSIPMDCVFLSDRDRHIASERINHEHRELRNKKITKSDIYRGIFNVNSIICGFAFMFANVAVQSIALFMPTIIAALGYESIQAQLYTVPVYTVATVVSVFMAWVSDRFHKRGIFVCSGSLLALAGYAILSTVNRADIKYAGVYVAAIGIFFIGTTVLAWVLNNTAGNSIRAVSSAFVVTMGNFGSLIAVWSYLANDAPFYKNGHLINMGAEAIVCLLGIAGIIYVKLENRQRNLGNRDFRLHGLSDEEADKLGYRHPSFRYLE